MDQATTERTDTNTAESAALGSTEPPKVEAKKASKVSKARKGKLSKATKAETLDVEGLDVVLTMLDAQDETLKEWKAQAQDMLRTNANLRKAIRHTVKEAAKHDELTAELASYRRKWANLQSLLS